MRFLQISFLFLLIIGCRSPKSVGFRELRPKSDFIENRYFSDASKDYIYKAKIEVKKHRFGGILIVKKLAEEHFRIVMTTEFGNKLIDFELQEQRFKLNEVIEELNRKLLLKRLRDDFIILTTERTPVIAAFENDNFDLLKGNLNGKKFFYSIDKRNNELRSVSRSGIGKNKLKINFDPVTKSLAERISILHPGIKLIIDLQYIGE